jgi:hypothetical protein
VFSISAMRTTFDIDGKTSSWAYADPDAAKPNDQTVHADQRRGP